MNLIAAFDGAIRKHSDKMFLRSGDVSISYGEMKARSHLAAAELRRFIQKNRLDSRRRRPRPPPLVLTYSGPPTGSAADR